MVHFFSEKYPNERMALYTRLLKESTQTPLMQGLEYFKKYIQLGGKQIHPILGDLHEFVQDVENQWDNDYGVNFVAAYLRSKFQFGVNENSAPDR